MEEFRKTAKLAILLHLQIHLLHQCQATGHYGLLSSKTILDLISFLYHIFNQKDGGRWETYCLYGVEGDGTLSIL